MKTLLTLDVYSHGVRISGYTRETFRILAIFLERLALKEPRRIPQENRTVMELKKRFYGLTDSRKESFIHRFQLDELLGYLKDRGIDRERIVINHIQPPEAAPATFELYDFYETRDYQVPIIEFMSDPTRASCRLDLQTGRGKTYCALKTLTNVAQRCVVMVSPKYFGIWEKALKESYKDIDSRYCTVSGSAELKALIEKGVEGELNYDIIIVSNVTYRTYLESYERFGEQMTTIGYLVPPPRFHEAIGAGFQINDEFQDDPGLVFRTDVYSNVQKQVYLSATPFTGNEFVTRMIDVMLPKETSCPLPEYDQYINVIGLMYQEPGIQKKDYLTPFKNTYNHARYETRLLKAKRRLERYKRIVFRVINGIYIKDRVPGQKLLVLCATVDFIRHLTTELRQQFPDLTIGEFVAGSDPKTLQTNDITVSTIKSAGTGQDIIDLREVLLLQATDSKKDNIQILGRLRRMKNFPDHTPRMTYMVCTDIPQSVKYFNRKKDHFDGRVVSHRVMRI